MPENLEDLIVIGTVGQRESQFLSLPGYYNRTLLKFKEERAAGERNLKTF